MAEVFFRGGPLDGDVFTVDPIDDCIYVEHDGHVLLYMQDSDCEWVFVEQYEYEPE